MAKENRPTVKDDDTYEELRKKGSSKEKAARIANAKASPKQHPSKKGGKAPSYEDWSRDELYNRAKELDVSGRSGMNTDELISALRSR